MEQASVATSGPTSSVTQRPLNTPEVNQAINTIESFGQTSSPHAHDFTLEAGVLKPKMKLSPGKLMRTFFSCVIDRLSPEKRKSQKQHKKVVQQTLSESIQVLKLYASRVPQLTQGDDDEQHLADRLIKTIEQFNDSRAQIQQNSFSQKIKTFFYEMAGWSLDKETISSTIPISTFYHVHKFSTQQSQNLSPNIITSKITTVAQKAHIHEGIDPFLQQEKELFTMKSTTLLLQNNIITKDDLAHTLPQLRAKQPDSKLIYDQGRTISSLSTTLALFPGEEIRLSGSFVRDQTRMRSTPLQDTFHIHFQALQTGFPHPLQTIGFTFGHHLLSAHLMPGAVKKHKDLEALLQKKQRLAKALLPNGKKNAAAKALLQVRKRVFKNHEQHFSTLLKRLMTAITQQECDTALQKQLDSPDPFITMSSLHNAMIEHTLSYPFIQQENPPVTQKFAFDPTDAYQSAFIQKILMAKPALLTLFFPQQSCSLPLNAFEKKILHSVFRHQLTFISECELNPEDTTIEDQIFQSIDSLFQSEIADFADEPLDTTLDNKALLLTDSLIALLTCSR